MKKPLFEWEIIIKGNDLEVMLNDGVNKVLKIEHEDFEKHLKELREEIEYYMQITRTKFKGETFEILYEMDFK